MITELGTPGATEVKAKEEGPGEEAQVSPESSPKGRLDRLRTAALDKAAAINKGVRNLIGKAPKDMVGSLKGDEVELDRLNSELARIGEKAASDLGVNLPEAQIEPGIVDQSTVTQIAAQEKPDSASERNALENDLISRFKAATGKEMYPATPQHRKLIELAKEADSSLLLEIFEPKYDALWTERSVVHTIVINSVRRSLEKTTIDKTYKLSQEEKDVTANFFAKLGIDRKQAANILSAWTSRNDSTISPEENTKQRLDVLASNFWSMIELHDNPECGEDGLRMLYDKYGIRNFGRYSSSQLIDQLQGRIQTPPKVVISAVADWNGGLADTGYVSEDILGKGVTYVEAESTIDAARRLVKVSREQGAIKTVLVNAHGNSKLMRFGRNNNQVLTTEQVANSKGITRLKDEGILDQRAEIILKSCDTGVKSGFAEALAEATTAKVTAPNFKSFGIEKSRILNRIKFTDEAGKSGAKTYHGRRRMAHTPRGNKISEAA